MMTKVFPALPSQFLSLASHSLLLLSNLSGRQPQGALCGWREQDALGEWGKDFGGAHEGPEDLPRFSAPWPTGVVLLSSGRLLGENLIKAKSELESHQY